MLALLLLLPWCLQPEGEYVVSVACGAAHSVVLLDSGVVYTAGANSNGQCGQDLQLREVSG